MVKNRIITSFVAFLVFVTSISMFNTSYAAKNVVEDDEEDVSMVEQLDDEKTSNVDLSENETELGTMKESFKEKLQGYIDSYGNVTYGFVAFLLNGLRLFSIPLCFLGIAWGVINQYVLGIRKLDVRDFGFRTIISCVTILLICQVLPLVFAIVVHGWRG